MPNDATGGARGREIKNGIEWFRVRVNDPSEQDHWDCQCARCGSSAVFHECEACGGQGVDGHDCGEDSCCCADPEDNVRCSLCRGEGGEWRCVSGLDWCQAHPMAGREGIASTALRSEAPHVD